MSDHGCRGDPVDGGGNWFCAAEEDGLAEVPQPRRWLWTGAVILAMGGPLLWPVIKPIPPVPEQVQAYWTADTITVVEVTDFECPHCRQTHAPLAEFLDRHARRIRFVRLVKPMDQHANAKSAARAYLCADAQGKAREMAEALFALEQLSPEACRQAAESVGLDMEEYQQCVASSETDERIEQLTGFVDQTNVQGLPVIWIEDQRLVGEQTLESLEAALARAAPQAIEFVASPRQSTCRTIKSHPVFLYSSERARTTTGA